MAAVRARAPRVISWRPADPRGGTNGFGRKLLSSPPLSFLPPPSPQPPSILTVSNAILRPSFIPLKLPKCTDCALGFRMLLLAALFISLAAFLGCAASKPSPRARYVVDVSRPRGLVPRQKIAGVMLGSQNSVPGTGITRLVLASDHRYSLILSWRKHALVLIY